MKNIVLLGSAGSIGENTIRVVETLSDRLRITGLAVKTNYDRVLEQAELLGVRHVAVADSLCADRCAADAPSGVKVYGGQAGVEELAALPDTDVVLCAVVGMSGLGPVMSAIRHGVDVALATKEVLVAAGAIVTAACARSGARLLPVDSEHSAIFQCLADRGTEISSTGVGDKGAGTRAGAVNRLALTASGGPFAFKEEIDLNEVTVEQALDHPSWRMGRKVTVDSATMMNKGLEIMEAHWLFDVPVDSIDVVLHPESIVHSLVEFVDGAVMAQLSVPDMRFAIQYALTYPERCDGRLPRLDLTELGALHFARPNVNRFQCLALARAAANVGGTMPAVLNAANEMAVERFLDGKIRLPGIWHIVESVMARHNIVDEPSLDAVMDADVWARRVAEECALQAGVNPGKHY